MPVIPTKENPNPPLFTLGLTTDAQYAEKEPWKDRQFRQGVERLIEARSLFEQHQVDAWLDLGDTIDEDEVHFPAVFEVFHSLDVPRYHCIGNHDYTISDQAKDQVPARFDYLTTHYTHFDKAGYRFLLLDGNDISLHKSKEGSEEREKAEELFVKAKQEGNTSANFWNAAISSAQLLWLEKRLEEAREQQLKVVCCCHYPILPLGTHSLWNAAEVAALILNYKDVVKLWLNGHQHHGDYVQHDGVHFLTLNGMVQGEGNAFALASFFEVEIHFQGFGRQRSIKLEIV